MNIEEKQASIDSTNKMLDELATEGWYLRKVLIPKIAGISYMPSEFVYRNEHDSPLMVSLEVPTADKFGFPVSWDWYIEFAQTVTNVYEEYLGYIQEAEDIDGKREAEAQDTLLHRIYEVE